MKTYTIIVTEQPEGGFAATVQELPGCATQGESLTATLAHVAEAIAGVESLPPSQ